MKSAKLLTITTSVILSAMISTTAMGAKGGGKGGGGAGGGGGGSGFDTPVEYELAIWFRDAETDGLRSDGAEYYDGDLGVDGEDPLLDAHIDASAGKNYGNLYFRTGDTLDRSLYLDNSDCLSESCMTLDGLHDVAFTVAATESLGGGFCGMSINQIITAPMQVTYFLPGVDKPGGFVYYEPNLKGKSPCRGDNGSAEVTVLRTGDNTWTVSGSSACVAASGERGVANMPFEFYVTDMSTSNCQ